MSATHPEIQLQTCLNAELSNPRMSPCQLCESICPANAIHLDSRQQPQLDSTLCTDCSACDRICPVDAVQDTSLNPQTLITQARVQVSQGNTALNAACRAATSGQADLRIGCHGGWDPLLLACLASEGVRTLHLDGIDQCASCPMRFGEQLLQQVEKDYATLNHSLGVRLEISHQAKKPKPTEEKPAADSKVPERRAFFRNLIPALTQGAAVATAQISQAASQALREEAATPPGEIFDQPERLALFLRALPQLNANFTPVPDIDSLPLGSIQADERCTACEQCVDQCPTQALEIREFGNRKILEFQPEACIGCSQCVRLCPEKALEKLPSISLPSLLAGRSRPLVMIPADRIAKPAASEKVDHG